MVHLKERNKKKLRQNFISHLFVGICTLKINEISHQCPNLKNNCISSYLIGLIG